MTRRRRSASAIERPYSPASRGRTRADVPEFGRVLGGRDEGIAAGEQGTHRARIVRVLRVGSLQEPKQDAGVNEYEHQSWSA